MSTETTNPAPETKKVNLGDDLSQQDALGILIQGVRFGQSKGIYSLEDAALLNKAVGVFIKKDETANAGQPETPPAV